jgi:hypothetical protein
MVQKEQKEQNNNISEDLTFIDYYTDVFASCGNGNIVFSDDTVKWLINENLTYINNIEKEYIKPISSNDNQYTIKQVYI